jgi:mono/diheme cytochrome c family protein
LSLSRLRTLLRASATSVALALFFSACQKSPGTQPAAPQDPQAALASRGRQGYQASCTACHNGDPHKAGSIGPDVAGSPRELIEARVLSASYPPGYTPKRATHAMAALPQLKGEIDALTAYLSR